MIILFGRFHLQNHFHYSRNRFLSLNITVILLQLLTKKYFKQKHSLYRNAKQETTFLMNSLRVFLFLLVTIIRRSRGKIPIFTSQQETKNGRKINH